MDSKKIVSKSHEELWTDFTKHVEANRDANKFRDATKDLLVNSKQVVVTLTIDPCSQEIIVTGESTTVKFVEEKGLDKVTLSDICDKIRQEAVWNSENLSFSELHNGLRRDFSRSKPVARLPTLKNIDPKGDDGNGWPVLLGRKVVGSYMTDIKHRENLKYNKNKNKRAEWLPKDVDKIYNANMTKDESRKVMEAIMDTFPEEVKPMSTKKTETSKKCTGKKRKNECENIVSKVKKHRATNSENKKHDDLRKKLFFSNRLNLVPKVGWEAWQNNLVKGKDCNDSKCFR